MIRLFSGFFGGVFSTRQKIKRHSQKLCPFCSLTATNPGSRFPGSETGVPENMVESAPLEAIGDECLNRFVEIGQGFFSGRPLGGEVEGGAGGQIPFRPPLHDHWKLEIDLCCLLHGFVSPHNLDSRG